MDDSKKEGYLGRFMKGAIKRVKDAATTFTAKNEPGFGDLFRVANAWVTGDHRPYPQCTPSETSIGIINGVNLSGSSLGARGGLGRIRVAVRGFAFEPAIISTTGDHNPMSPKSHIMVAYATIRDLHMPVQINSSSGPSKLRIVLHTFHTFTLEINNYDDALALFRALVARTFAPDGETLYRRWGLVESEPDRIESVGSPTVYHDAESGNSSGAVSPDTSSSAKSHLAVNVVDDSVDQNIDKTNDHSCNMSSVRALTTNSPQSISDKVEPSEVATSEEHDSCLQDAPVTNGCSSIGTPADSNTIVSSAVDEGCVGSEDDALPDNQTPHTEKSTTHTQVLCESNMIQTPKDVAPTSPAIDEQKCQPHCLNSIEGLFDLAADYERMKLSSRWRQTSINVDWTICETYPETLYVPTDINDDQIRNAAQYRAKGRFPVLAYSHSNGAVILRSAQPLTGINNARNADDEALIVAACTPSSQSKSMQYHIMDARPMINAIANIAGGKGYETWSNYGKHCHGHFLEIENIHAMRSSLNSLIEACANVPRPGGESGEGSAVDYSTYFPSAKFEAQIDRSRWLSHVGQVLAGADAMVHAIESCESVLVHCSDGWDRTSQLSALAQVMLDPFYRTMSGLEVLIRREWLAFGHKFEDRLGRMITKENEASPIFVQFLECIWQLMRINPSSFEFTSTYLVELYATAVSGAYGTFLGNSDRMRSKFGLDRGNRSLWVEARSALGVHKNPQYVFAADTLRFTGTEPVFFAEMYLPFSYEAPMIADAPPER